MTEKEIQKWAHQWWNWESIITDSFPPDELYPIIIQYIQDHPEEFKGAGPQ